MHKDQDKAFNRGRSSEWAQCTGLLSSTATSSRGVGGAMGKLLLLGSQNTNRPQNIMYKPIDFHFFFWQPFLPITDSCYRNIDCSRINCFCFPVSLTQQNNSSQLNIWYCSYGSHIHEDCAQGTLAYSLDSTVNILKDLKYTLNESV